MSEGKKEQLNNLSKPESSERGSSGKISYEEFKKISEEILNKYRENPGKVDINCNPEVIEKIIEFFPEEIRNLCQEILGEKPLKDKIDLLVKDISQDDIRILKETTENLIGIIIGKEFREKKEEDFTKEDLNSVNRLWMTPLRALERIIDKIEIEKMKIK